MTRILIVDDNDALRRLLALVLVDAGYEVEEAKDGREAMRLHRREPVAVVITDILMPEMDGIELLRELRRESPAPRCIAVTGVDRVEHAMYLKVAERLGASRVLLKPFTNAALLAAVEEVLAK